jgi:hypothetical protein
VTCICTRRGDNRLELFHSRRRAASSLTAMGKRKRPQNIDNIIASVDLPEGWVETLLEDENLGALLAELANRGGISNSAFKKARMGLPSFSDAKWADIAPEFGLHPDTAILQLPSFTTPVYLLPPSFHVETYISAWNTLDVYREVEQQTREEARVRILDPVCLLYIFCMAGSLTEHRIVYCSHFGAFSGEGYRYAGTTDDGDAIFKWW